MDSIAAASAEIPFATARSIFSFGIFSFFAVSITVRKVGELTSPPAFFDSTAMRLASLPHTLLFAASFAPFCRFICDHLLCPPIRKTEYDRKYKKSKDPFSLPAQREGGEQAFQVVAAALLDAAAC